MAETATVGFLRVLLTANTAEFDSAMKKVSGTAARVGKDLGTIGRQATSAGRALTTGITLPLVGLAAAASKSAIDFESSFAGVRKTVKATEAEFSAMSAAFRQLAKDIPINVNELNRLGEAAGALGIPKAEIVDFARVMALLGVTTNVTSDQAAESIAKIQNIFGAAGKETEQFGSALVALGNNGASTESQILEMATRIAGAGSVIGLSQGQVLGFASALSSVGLEAEVGGTAISRVFVNMSSAVSSGGEKLEQFAKVAGMSADTFAQKFKTDAAGAVLAFIEGLGRIKQSGGDLIGTLSEMDITEVRLRDTLLRVAGAGDLVRGSLQTQAEAWRTNGPLIDEARERFKTTESQLTLLWNRVKDVGITLGNALLPTITSTIGVLNQLIPILDQGVKWFGSLPTGVQATAIGFTALVAAAGPALFLFGQLALSAQALVALFGPAGLATKVITLTGGFGGLTSGVSALATALGPAVLVAAVLGAAAAFNELEKGTRDSLQAVKEGNATWSDLPNVLMNAVSRGINPLGAAMRDLADIWKRLPGEITVFKDAVVRISQQLYEGVRTWLVDRFGAIVESLRGKVEAVKGYFKDLYDKVIGNSYVPDLVAGIIREFNRLQGGMVAPTLVATSEVGTAFSALKGRVLGDLSQMKDGVLQTLGDMLVGAEGWKDGFLDIWRQVQQGISQIISDIINDVGNRLIKGLTNMLTGQGGLGSAFSGFLGLGGGGVGADGVAGLGNFTVGGLPGATPWWSTAAGGGAIGGAAGATAGWVVGRQTGNTLGSVGAGAGVGAGVGAAFGGPVGAGIGALIGAGVGWYSAMRERMQTNDERDAFFNQFGPGGTGIGSGFHNVAAKLTEAGAGAGGGRLFKDLIEANDGEALAKAIQAVNQALAAFEARTKTATEAEADHAAAIEATKQEYQARIDVLKTEMQSLDAEIKKWDELEAPEEVMGAVEQDAREKIEKQKATVQAALDAQQQAMEAALAATSQAATESGEEAARGITDGYTMGYAKIDERAGETRRHFDDLFGGLRYTIGIDYTVGTLPPVPAAPMPKGFIGGTPDLDFMDFGRESLVRLHGEEAVVPKGDEAAFAARHGVLGGGSSLTPSEIAAGVAMGLRMVGLDKLGTGVGMADALDRTLPPYLPGMIDRNPADVRTKLRTQLGGG